MTKFCKGLLLAYCKGINIGDEVVVTKNLYGARTEQLHDILDKHLRNGNKSMVNIMVNAGTAAPIYKGKTGKVLKAHKLRYEILFDDDLGLLWVEAHAVDKK